MHVTDLDSHRLRYCLSIHQNNLQESWLDMSAGKGVVEQFGTGQYLVYFMMERRR